MSQNIHQSLKNEGLAHKKESETEKIDVPIDIGDIIEICREYHSLGWQIQNEIEFIRDFGIAEGLNRGVVKPESLFIIKSFFQKIVDNAWFGDAADQACEVAFAIEDYICKHPHLFRSRKN